MKLAILAAIGLVGAGTVIAFTREAPPQFSMTIDDKRMGAAGESNGSEQGQEGGAELASAPLSESMLTNPDQLAIQRNAYLSAAIQSLEQSTDDLICARTAYFLDAAQKVHREQGTPVEMWLLEQSAQFAVKGQDKANSFGGFDGSPVHQQEGRAVVIDQLAILRAIEGSYKGEVDRSCIVQPLPGLAQASQFVIAARSYRAIAELQHRQQIEQQLQQGNEQVARQVGRSQEGEE